MKALVRLAAAETVISAAWAVPAASDRTDRASSCFLKEMFFMEMTSWMDGVEMETVEIYTVI